MNEFKNQIIKAIDNELQERIKLAKESYQDAKESRDHETKSSAGDKHETGRAMMQQEMDRTETRIIQLQTFINEFKNLPVDEDMSVVAPGSVVQTDSGCYFIGLSLGKVHIDDWFIHAISVASPLGRLLLRKTTGEEVVLNGTIQKINAIY